MALKWTRTHSLRADLPPDADTSDIKKKLKAIKGVIGCDSTPSVLTMGFAHRYSPAQLRRGPYRQVRTLLIAHGVITKGTRALPAT